MTISTPPLISMILITWDRKDELQKALESLDRQTIRDQIEVIVVDNGSTDGTLELLRDWPHPVRLLENSENLGPGVGRNQAVRLAWAPVCGFLDTDAWLVEDDLLETVLTELDEDAQCQGASCFIYLDAEKTEFFARGCYMTPEGHFDPERTESDWENPDFLTTCFCLYRRAAIIRAGGFDPWYGYGIEDADMGVSIRERTDGFYRVLPDRAVIHEMSMEGRKHRWNDFGPKFRYLEWMRHYYLIRRGGAALFFRIWRRLLRRENRGLLGGVYKMWLTREQRIKAHLLYPLAYVFLLPRALIHSRRDHLQAAPDPAQVSHS